MNEDSAFAAFVSRATRKDAEMAAVVWLAGRVCMQAMAGEAVWSAMEQEQRYQRVLNLEWYNRRVHPSAYPGAMYDLMNDPETTEGTPCQSLKS